MKQIISQTFFSVLSLTVRYFNNKNSLINKIANKFINNSLRNNNNNNNNNINTGLEIFEVIKNPNLRCLEFRILNKDMLEYGSLYRSLFYTLQKNKDFINFTKYRVVISTAITYNREYNLHHNI
jgi:hypothetical protein